MPSSSGHHQSSHPDRPFATAGMSLPLQQDGILVPCHVSSSNAHNTTKVNKWRDDVRMDTHKQDHPKCVIL